MLSTRNRWLTRHELRAVSVSPPEQRSSSRSPSIWSAHAHTSVVASPESRTSSLLEARMSSSCRPHSKTGRMWWWRRQETSRSPVSSSSDVPWSSSVRLSVRWASVVLTWLWSMRGNCSWTTQTSTPPEPSLRVRPCSTWTGQDCRRRPGQALGRHSPMALGQGTEAGVAIHIYRHQGCRRRRR